MKCLLHNFRLSICHVFFLLSFDDTDSLDQPLRKQQVTAEAELLIFMNGMPTECFLMEGVLPTLTLAAITVFREIARATP